MAFSDNAARRRRGPEVNNDLAGSTSQREKETGAAGLRRKSKRAKEMG